MENQLDSLIQQIFALVDQLPEEWLEKLSSILMAMDTRDQPKLRALMVNAVPKSNAQQSISEFIDYWLTEASDVQADSLALALLTAIKVKERYQQQQKIELVWTGPTSQVIPMRRTDQALMQLIRNAEDTLLIVSFAVYRIKTIVESLISAATRGVKISILIETPDESEGRIAFDTIFSFGSVVRSQAKFYVWPRDQRPTTHDGKQGSLHAKLAVADSKALFISSANLTEYAMHLNMELGTLIVGGPLPATVESHFSSLIEKGALRRISTS